MNKGNGPWFVVLLNYQNKFTVYCHTYAYQQASLLNAMQHTNKWNTIALVGPFNSLKKGNEYALELQQNEPNIESCIVLCDKHNVYIWEITKPVKKKCKRLTLEMLDQDITIDVLRKILSEG